MHLTSTDLVKTVKFVGHAEVSFIGFGPADMTAAPEVGFNLTYVCPEGQVFNHDWFATPFVMMTCQVTIQSMKDFEVTLSRKTESLMSLTGQNTSVLFVSIHSIFNPSVE